ncbi:MAG: hypothetical protein IKK52_04385, partial [Alphaproteobacteria bacterium]|nr:hypothetical protein [Alphaproteobacteria bacterium]
HYARSSHDILILGVTLFTVMPEDCLKSELGIYELIKISKMANSARIMLAPAMTFFNFRSDTFYCHA